MNMHLQVETVTPADLDAAATIYGPETGDLVAPLCQICWAVDPTDTDSARLRAEWSCQQQKDLLTADPSTRFVKVIDTDVLPDQQIVALGRWHEYPSGYTQVEDLEVTGLKDREAPDTWPKSLNKAFYTGFLDECLAGRREWMGHGHYWGSTPDLPLLHSIILTTT